MHVPEPRVNNFPRTEDGRLLVSQSMMKTFLGCPREAMYKYHMKLQPKKGSLPLERGKWMHTILESYYKGEDWKPEHAKLVNRYNQLFDEEKENLGDLPTEIESLWDAYQWHYGDPQYKDETDWKIHEVELKLQAELPNGHILSGKFDMLIENQHGLYLVDHKTHKKFPDWTYRMLDMQSPIYTWLCQQNGIPVNGFIWNYIRTSGIPTPKLLKSNKNFYSKDFSNETDYPTFAGAVKRNLQEFGYKDGGPFLADPDDRAQVKARLAYLKGLRWSPDGPQESPFFRREVIEKSDEMVERVLASVVRTTDRINEYDFSDPDSVERNIGNCKSFMCSYKQLNMGDLVNGDSSISQRRDFKVHNPMAYQDTNDQMM